MKKIFLFYGIFLFLIQAAFAEVPGHNPDLDSKCGEGFQWSTLTVACEQTNCPPGAGRTYTLECNCGEAWNKPFRTCYSAIGLASHCISSDQNCDDVRGGFDPLTGECKFMEGFEWNADKTDCVRLYPENMKCRIQDPQGNPVSNLEVTFGEYSNDMMSPETSGKVTTNQNGEAQFSVSNRQSKMIKFIVRKGNGYYTTFKEVPPDSATDDCVFTIYTNEQIEKWIKDEYVTLLTDACLDQSMIDKVRNAKIVFDDSVSNSQYDAENNVLRVSSGDMGSDFDSLTRALMHEFGHFISDQIIDPTSIFIKGYPLKGKYVGGSHNNWEPHAATNNWGPDIDPYQNAFEEAMADFMANQYFASKGKIYQDDLTTQDKSAEVLAVSGRENAAKIEGVIATFLIEYYKKQTESGEKGAARALGDFIRAVRYNPRKGTDWINVPARTIREFIESKRKSEQNDTPNDCTPAQGQAGDLSGLANTYGIDGSKEARIKLVSKNMEQKKKNQQAMQGMTFGNPLVDSLTSLIPVHNRIYEFPEGTAPVVEFYPANFAETGKVQRVSFNPDNLNMFSVDPSNIVTIENGSAKVSDTSVSTPNLTITNNGTEYIVQVDGGEETVEVIEGSVTLTEKTGEGREYSVTEGMAATYNPEDGFEEKDQELSDELTTGVDSSDSESFFNGGGNNGGDSIGLAFKILIVILAVAVAYLFLTRKK